MIALVFLFISALTFFYIAKPLFAANHESKKINKVFELNQIKENLMFQIRELELDFNVNKLDQASYEQSKKDLDNDLAKILNEIDQCQVS